MNNAQRKAAERLADALTEIANSRPPSAAGFAVAEAAALLRELLGQDMREVCREYGQMQREDGVFRGKMTGARAAI
jgi:hypothetical protein